MRSPLLPPLAAAMLLAGCGRPVAPPAPPLRIGLYTAPASLDPHLLNEFVTVSVLSNAYEGLTGLDALLRVRPALAESWENPDEKTCRFHLRRGVTFHDGRPMTAADVVFSLERARGHARSEFKSYLGGVASVRALDDLTVEIASSRSNLLLPTKLAFVMIVPRGSAEEIKSPVGTGPYRLRLAGRGETVVLAAHDRYWGGHPAVPEVHLKVVGGPSRIKSLLSGDVDLLLDVAPDEVPAAGNAVRIVSRPSPAVDILRMRLDGPPFADVRVRRAVSLALDRQRLVAGLAGGHGAPAGQLVSRNVFGFDPELPAPERDLAAARRLLAEAGYANGIEVELEHRADLRLDEIARQLGEAGIRVQLRPRHWHELVQRLQQGKARFAYLSLVSDSGEATDILESTLHSRDAASGLGESNVSPYSNRRLDRLIEQAARTPELEERRLLLGSCLRLAAEDLPLVPLFERDFIWGVREGVIFQPRADGRVLAWDLRRLPPS
jgi:peptide/nickel transport system substrate-binding protein